MVEMVTVDLKALFEWVIHSLLPQNILCENHGAVKKSISLIKIAWYFLAM